MCIFIYDSNVYDTGSPHDQVSRLNHHKILLFVLVALFVHLL